MSDVSNVNVAAGAAMHNQKFEADAYAKWLMQNQNLQTTLPPIRISDAYATIPYTYTEPAILLHQISKYTVTPQDSYGGKAFGLAKLMKLNGGLNVPMSFAIHVDHTFTRGGIDLSPLPKFHPHSLWAVRSGAPVSMPGLLDTVLNVPLSEIQQAVEKVWDSWNTPRAIDYRKQRNIPSAMGTGVVIQQMITPVYSGVAFTSDLYLPSKAFNLTSEYVSGFGDKLVGGSVTPTRGLPKGCGSDAFERVHRHMGPSDLEWVIDANGNIWFLQWRPMKAREFPVSTQPDIIEGQLACKGTPIGGRVAPVTGRLRVTAESFQPGDIFYATGFTPDTYPILLRASAILATRGGELCHAALVARELNRPAISDLPVETILPLRDRVVTVHSDGSVYVAASTDEVTAVSVLSSPPVHEQSRTPKKVWLLHPYCRTNSTTLLVRYYCGLSEFQNGTMPETDWTKLLIDISDVLACYFYYACCGEARHATDHGYAASVDRQEAVEEARALGLRITPDRPERERFVRDYTAEPKSLSEAIACMDVVTRIFNSGDWGGGYGGPMWAQISQMVKDYLDGQLSRTAFVDACFNLQHNGGSALNKFDWMFHDATVLQQLLDARRSMSAVNFKEFSKGYSSGTIPIWIEGQHEDSDKETESCGCGSHDCSECYPDGCPNYDEHCSQCCNDADCETCHPELEGAEEEPKEEEPGNEQYFPNYQKITEETQEGARCAT